MKKFVMIIAAFAAISAVSVNAAASIVPTNESFYSVSPYYQSACLYLAAKHNFRFLKYGFIT